MVTFWGQLKKKKTDIVAYLNDILLPTECYVIADLNAYYCVCSVKLLLKFTKVSNAESQNTPAKLLSPLV